MFHKKKNQFGFWPKPIKYKLTWYKHRMTMGSSPLTSTLHSIHTNDSGNCTNYQSHWIKLKVRRMCRKKKANGCSVEEVPLERIQTKADDLDKKWIVHLPFVMLQLRIIASSPLPPLSPPSIPRGISQSGIQAMHFSSWGRNEDGTETREKQTGGASLLDSYTYKMVTFF